MPNVKKFCEDRYLFQNSTYIHFDTVSRIYEKCNRVVSRFEKFWFMRSRSIDSSQLVVIVTRPWCVIRFRWRKYDPTIGADTRRKRIRYYDIVEIAERRKSRGWRTNLLVRMFARTAPRRRRLSSREKINFNYRPLIKRALSDPGHRRDKERKCEKAGDPGRERQRINESRNGGMCTKCPPYCEPDQYRPTYFARIRKPHTDRHFPAVLSTSVECHVLGETFRNSNAKPRLRATESRAKIGQMNR